MQPLRYWLAGDREGMRGREDQGRNQSCKLQSCVVPLCVLKTLAPPPKAVRVGGGP